MARLASQFCWKTIDFSIPQWNYSFGNNREKWKSGIVIPHPDAKLHHFFHPSMDFCIWPFPWSKGIHRVIENRAFNESCQTCPKNFEDLPIISLEKFTPKRILWQCLPAFLNWIPTHTQTPSKKTQTHTLILVMMLHFPLGEEEDEEKRQNNRRRGN